MKFKFLLNTILCNIIFLLTASQTNYFYPGENKFTSELRYHVPFQQHLLDSKDIQFNIELIKEVKIEKQPFTFISDNAKLFYFQNITTEEDNMIMVLDNNSNLYCLYLIKNYLLNQQIVITPHFCNITLPYKLCTKLVQVNKEIYVSNCFLNNNQAVISIINLDGKVFDQLIFEIESNCKIEFSYGDLFLFIYHQNCESDYIYNVEIDEHLYQYKSFKKFDIILEDNITNFSFGEVQKINICNKDRFIFISKNYMVYNNFKDTMFHFTSLGDNITILNEFQSCKKTQIILSIDNNNQQLKFDRYDLNITYNQQYINTLLIDKMIVLHFKDYIIVKINDQLQQTIDISIKEIVQIADSSYFFGFYKSELKLFQLQPPKYFHSFNTSQRIIYIIFKKWNSLRSFILEQSNIEILNQSEPKIIINQQDMIIEQNNKNEICFEQSEISKSLPINLYVIQENQRYYSINKTQNIETYNLNFGQQVLHFWQFNNLINILLVSVQSKDLIILIFYQQNKVIKKYNIKILQNYIDIGIIQKFNILIFYENNIQYFIIDNSLQIKQTEIPSKNKIIKINKSYNQIYISYDNCKKSVINYIVDDLLVLELTENYTYNCTQTQQISNSNLYIFQNYIILRSNGIQKYIQVGKIIDVLEDVDQSVYVLILDEGNEIVLKLYRIHRATDFIFQYNIPTYIFIYESSVHQKIENGYLMINAKNQNKTFLLVYNLRNQAINSLIYITEIDSSQLYYSLFDFNNKTIVFLNDAKLYFHNLNQICLKYSFNIENTIIQKKQLEFFVNSFINNLITTTKIQIYKLNSDYSLGLLNQRIRSIYYEDALDFDLIRGNIIKFQIQPTQDFIIKLPINITQEYFSCQYYESSICLYDGNIIEIKSLNIKDRLPFMILDGSIKSIIQDSLNYTIFYVDIKNTLQQLILQLKKNESNQFTIQIKEIIKEDLFQKLIDSIYKVKKIRVIKIFFYFQQQSLLFYNNYCQILDFQDINSIDGVYLQSNTYLFLFCNSSIIQMSIISFNNIQLISEFKCKGDIIQYHQINLIDIFEQLYFQAFDRMLNKIEIIHFEIKGDLFTMKFVMIYKIYLLLLVEISFNRIKYDNFVIQSYRFLRYEQNTQFLDLLYADNNIVVLTLLQDSNEFINVYDIKGERRYKDYLDSIQRMESLHYKKIEKFNSSHYVIYNHKNDIVQFMTINKLKIECQGQCNEPANLTLFNDVSSISLKIELKHISKLVQQGLIITNLIFIFIYIKFRKRVKQQIQRNQ